MINGAIEEKTIFFELPGTDGLRIKAILRGTLDGPLAVIVHGRPGNGNALPYYLCSRYLYERDISSLRLFMYAFEPRTRNLMDCTLQTHADDFDAVIRELRRKNVEKIFAIGHSYGGLTILKSGTKLDAGVLWDPSHGSYWAEGRDAQSADMFPEETVGKYRIGTAGQGWVYPLAGREYDMQLDDTSAWAAKDYPLEVITAGKGILKDLNERYYLAAREPKRHVVVTKAHHGFDDSDQVMLELFKKTYEWLEIVE